MKKLYKEGHVQTAIAKCGGGDEGGSSSISYGEAFGNPRYKYASMVGCILSFL
jgi:hypothetical protein